MEARRFRREGDEGEEAESEARARATHRGAPIRRGKHFLPLEGGSGKRLRKQQQPDGTENNTATVLCIGHIPHGFDEEQMQGFFQQFGAAKMLRIAQNRKTGKSKHYGFIEFKNSDVTKVVADEINNYLLFEHALQIALVPLENVHPKF